MLRLTLRQARGTAGRLVLAGLAVALGTGFVAAVLLISALFARTAAAAASTGFAGADVVVTGGSVPLDDAAVAAVAGAAGVAAAEGRVESGVQLVGPGRSEYVGLQSVATVPQLQREQVERGVLPTGPAQVALTTGTAQRLGVGVGDQVQVRTYPAPARSTDVPDPVDVPVTVVGLVPTGPGGPLGGSELALARPQEALAWTGTTTTGGPTTGYGSVLAVAADATSAEQARDAVTSALATTAFSQAQVQTAQQRTDEVVDSFTGGTQVLTGVVLAFAAVALFVAASVITTTFSVLVAQRTRQLALLRCIGATCAQVRRGVLAEAAALGLVASLAGVAGGTALAAAAAAVLGRATAGTGTPSEVVLTPAAVLVPVAVGVLATVLAALAPARAATRVSPLAALRPVAPPDLRTGGSRLRLAAALALGVGGLLLLAGGTALATGPGWASGPTSSSALSALSALAVVGLPAAVLGGATSFVGVLLGAVFLVPRVVAAVGALAARAGGAPARLAALNAVRDPRRTASTTSALLIATTLVALMVVGAATTSRTLAAALDRQFPVDAVVSGVAGADDAGGAGAGLDPAVVRAAAGVAGVAASAPLLTAEVTTRGGAGAGPQGQVHGLTAVAADPASLARVLTAPGTVAGLAPGVVVVPEEVAQRVGVSDGDPLALTALGEDGGPTRDLSVVVSALGGDQVVLTTADLTAVVPGAAPSALWLRLAPDVDPAAVSVDLQVAVSDAAGALPVFVDGAAVQRALLERVIDAMLAVVVALLAVAVVIALVGVANTLSLSVIERTRENAVLRSLGLTRGQLRRMLALEGALVAGVGGLLGVVLGSLYGWTGAASLLGGLAAATPGPAWVPALPWGRLALLLLVAVAAGLVASVLPARRALRTPPVSALADR